MDCTNSDAQTLSARPAVTPTASSRPDAAEHEPLDDGRIGAKGHANADFSPAPVDAV